MGKIEQLADLCRTTLQRLENNGDIASALLQADQVFMLHGCSSLNALLRPLSLSGDRGLLRSVAERSVADRGGEVNVRRDSTRRPARRSPPDQGESPQPDGSARSATAQLSQRQSTPVLPAGVDSSPDSQQLVQKVLNRVRQELKTEQEEKSRSSRTLPFDVFSSAEEKKGLQSLKTMSGGSQRQILAADHEHNASQPFPDITPEESDKTGWFERHPGHKNAAGSLLLNELPYESPDDSGQFISKNILKAWAAPLLSDDGLKEGNISLQDNKRGGAVLASAQLSPSRPGKQDQASPVKAGRKVSTFHVDEPDSRKNNPLLQPETTSPSLPEQVPPSSQLEQLLQKWQGGTRRQVGSQTTRGEENQPVKGQPNDVSTGPFPQGLNDSEDRGGGKTLDAVPQSPIDNDHVFSETLERVLKREIRRHGMEEEP